MYTTFSGIAAVAGSPRPECLHDINASCSVDGGDVGMLLSCWGTVVGTASRACDFNGDGQVDGADLGVLLTKWGPCPD
jgi:hypothetical protein